MNKELSERSAVLCKEIESSHFAFLLFSKLVREIVQDYKIDIKFQITSFAALQEIVEYISIM